MEAPIELSIVMPCLNERETVGVCVRKALAGSSHGGISGEVIIGDNGSTDGSVEIAEAEGARVIHVADKGYGNALKGGILAARAKYVLMGDSDDSYDFGHIMRFLEQLRAGSDLVMGNRFQRRYCKECHASAAPLSWKPGANGHWKTVISPRRARTFIADCGDSGKIAFSAWTYVPRGWSLPVRWW